VQSPPAAPHPAASTLASAPSASPSPAPVQAQSPPAPEQPSATPAHSPSDAEQSASPATAGAHQASPLVRAFREQESSQPPLADLSSGLVNIAEILTREKIALVMERMKVCTCRTCYNDVLALTLNALPTKYVTTSTGKQHFQRGVYKEQYETDILAALTKACVRVKASPRH
jgi:competence protein ComFB